MPNCLRCEYAGPLLYLCSLITFISSSIPLWYQTTLTSWCANLKGSPYGGVGLIACGNMHFACETDDCLKSNFMLPDTHLLLRDDQKRTIALSSMSISTSAGTTLNPSATLSTLTYTPTFTTSSSAARFSQGSRFVALGASVGVFLGIALFAVFALLLIEKRKNRRLVQAKHRITAENESSTGPIWINEYGPAVEVPQDLAQHELPSGRLAHELDDRRTRE